MKPLRILKNRIATKAYVQLNFNDTFDKIKYNLYKENKLFQEKVSYKNIHDVTFSIEKMGSYHAEVLCYKEEQVLTITSQKLTFVPNIIRTKLEYPKKESILKKETYAIKDSSEYYLFVSFYHNDLVDIKEQMENDPILKKISLKSLFNPSYQERLMLNEKEEHIHYAYEVKSNVNSIELLSLAHHLEKQSYVKEVFLESSNIIPANISTSDNPQGNNKPILNFNNLQDYSNLGINDQTSQYKGQSATIRHMDSGYYPNHEEFKSKTNIHFVQHDGTQEDHGTASLGLLVSHNTEKGVNGICPESDTYLYTIDQGFPAIISSAKAGDIVNLNIQQCVADYLLPIDNSSFYVQAIKKLTERGVIVILSAGNGDVNLDTNPIYNNPGDYGGIKVGACNRSHLNACSFSNSGKDIYFNCWGDYSIVTTGYGDLYGINRNNKSYTASFGGTSASATLLAGILAIIQGYTCNKYNTYLDAYDMREILNHSRDRSAQYKEIGITPNLETALQYVDKVIR